MPSQQVDTPLHWCKALTDGVCLAVSRTTPEHWVGQTFTSCHSFTDYKLKQASLTPCTTSPSVRSKYTMAALCCQGSLEQALSLLTWNDTPPKGHGGEVGMYLPLGGPSTKYEP